MNKKAPINARALVAKLQQDSIALQEREILAPLLPHGRIRTRLNGLVYEFKARGNLVGWGRFQPFNEQEAEVLGEALPWQRAAYLELFPILRVILLWPVGAEDFQKQKTVNPKSPLLNRKSAAWWALPFNESDARQRFGIKTVEPLPVFLCDPLGGADRFERALVRVDGQTLWFDGPDLKADPQKSEWLRQVTTEEEETVEYPAGLTSSERLALLYWQIHQLEGVGLNDLNSFAEFTREEENHQSKNRPATNSFREQRQRLQQHQARLGLENRLRKALNKADAVLSTFTETTNPDGSNGPLLIEWTARGDTHRYRSLIEPGMTVVSSGICLSGRDRDFDLTSLVSVVRSDQQYD